DRDVVRGDDPEKRILEVKTTDTWNRTEWGPSGSDEVPDHYLTQVQHYMALTGADICDVAVLVGGNDFRVLHVPRNDRLIGAMLERYVDFWERHVEAKVPPVGDDAVAAGRPCGDRGSQHRLALHSP